MRLLIINKKSIYIFLILIIIILAIATYIFTHNKIDETFNMDVYYKGNINKKIVAFACNVDWGNEYIPPMLEVFREYDINISYFITGKWAENNPELLKMIYDHNHEIGNHGYRHVDYDKLNYEKNKTEILKTHNIIQDILGIEPIYFAPPSGAYNDETIKAAKDLNYDIIMWSIDTIDWREDATKDIIINRITDKLHNSAIVLMHPTENTLLALPELIDHLLAQGYEVTTVGNIVKNK